MGEEDTTFGAIVVAGVSMLLGTKLLVGAMIALLSIDQGSIQLLVESVPATAIVGTFLLITTGAMVASLWWSRSLAIVVLAVVAVLGRPAMGDPVAEPIALAQTAFAAVTVLYLLVQNPVPKQDRSDIDESTSASRLGSTIR